MKHRFAERHYNRSVSNDGRFRDFGPCSNKCHEECKLIDTCEETCQSKCAEGKDARPGQVVSGKFCYNRQLL